MGELQLFSPLWSLMRGSSQVNLFQSRSPSNVNLSMSLLCQVADPWSWLLRVRSIVFRLQVSIFFLTGTLRSLAQWGIFFKDICFSRNLRRRQWHLTPVLLPGNSMDGGAWWAAVHGVAKSRTRQSDFTFTFYFHALEKEMATHSSVLAWRIPGTVEPGELPSMGSHRVGHDWSDLVAAGILLLPL